MKKIIYLLLHIIAQPLFGTDVIHQQQSQYSSILVREQDDIRCLQFASSEVKQKYYQGCISTDSHAMIFNYSKALMASLLLKPDPQRLLFIGLGAGIVPKAMHFLHPNAIIDVVEIDSVVVDIAQNYFSFPKTDAMPVHVADGRVFVNQALAEGAQYDIVVIDAFNSEYVPEHLMTEEFLQSIRSLLTQDGVVASNTFSNSALYDHESMTYASVFGEFYNIQVDNDRANRIILGTRTGFLPIPVVQQNAQHYHAIFKSIFDIDVQSLLPEMEMAPNWDQSVRVLTDQYSPGNVLNGQHPVNRSWAHTIDQFIQTSPLLSLIGFMMCITFLFVVIYTVGRQYSQQRDTPQL